MATDLTENVIVRLTPEDKRALTALALRSNQTISDTVRQLIRVHDRASKTEATR